MITTQLIYYLASTQRLGGGLGGDYYYFFHFHVFLQKKRNEKYIASTRKRPEARRTLPLKKYARRFACQRKITIIIIVMITSHIIIIIITYHRYTISLAWTNVVGVRVKGWPTDADDPIEARTRPCDRGHEIGATEDGQGLGPASTVSRPPRRDVDRAPDLDGPAEAVLYPLRRRLLPQTAVDDKLPRGTKHYTA